MSSSQNQMIAGHRMHQQLMDHSSQLNVMCTHLHQCRFVKFQHKHVTRQSNQPAQAQLVILMFWGLAQLAISVRFSQGKSGCTLPTCFPGFWWQWSTFSSSTVMEWWPRSTFSSQKRKGANLVLLRTKKIHWKPSWISPKGGREPDDILVLLAS